MRNWSSIEELERGARDSFLINRKPTETEIYRTKGLLEGIQETMTTIETLSRGQGYHEIKPNIRGQLEENTVRLILACESFKQMINDDKGLADQLAFDIARIKKNSRKILDKALNYSGDIEDL